MNIRIIHLLEHEAVLLCHIRVIFGEGLCWSGKEKQKK